MSDQDPSGKGFNRPWEESDEEAGEVVRLPGVDDEDEVDDFDDVVEETAKHAGSPVEDEAESEQIEARFVDWEQMSSGTGDFEKYSSQEYLSATTEEYQGLAEEISRAETEEWQQQAISAPLPGVGSGLVGFEDVSGTGIGSEESFEALEQAASSDLAMRFASGLVIFGLFLGSLLLGGWWFTAFLILLMLVAVGELYATMRSRGFKPLALFGLVGVLAIGIATHTGGVYAIGAWLIVVSLVTLLFVSMTPRGNPLGDSAVTIMGLAWVGSLAFAIPFGHAETPVAWVLFIVFLVAINDMGAYFVGRAFGKRALAPNLSPNKTVEGVVGGLIVAAMASSILVTFPAWEAIGLGRGLVLAGIVGVFTPLGDMAESMVKRSIDVKDMGSVLPGHGGMLDRIDGFLFAVPALYFAFVAYGLL